MIEQTYIVELLEKEKALSLAEIKEKLGLTQAACNKLIDNLEKKKKVIIFGGRSKVNKWEDIVTIANPQGIKEGTKKATHIPKSISWKGWENIINGLNTLSRKVDAITISQLIEWIGEDPRDPDYQSIATRVIKEAGWTPLYNIFDKIVWLSPRLKREIEECIT
jgi:DNA-binding Lrp family transcriptional regulator